MKQTNNILELLNGKTPFQQKYIVDNAKSLLNCCVSFCKHYDIYEDTKTAFKTLKNYVHDPFDENTEAQTEEEYEKKLDELYDQISAGFYLYVDDYDFDYKYYSQLEKASDDYSFSAKSWENFQSKIVEYENIRNKYDKEYAQTTDCLIQKCAFRLLNDKDVENMIELYNFQTPKTDATLHFTIAQIRKLLVSGKLSEFSSASGRKKQFFKLQCGKNLNQLKKYVENLDLLAEIYDDCYNIFQEQVKKAQSK